MRAAAASLTAGLAWKATPRPAAVEHRNVIGAVADRKRVVASEPETRTQCVERRQLGFPAEHRIGHLAGQLAAGIGEQRIGVIFVKADHRGDLRRERGEAAGDEAGIGAVRPHGGDQRASARRQADALGDHLVDHGRRAGP